MKKKINLEGSEMLLLCVHLTLGYDSVPTELSHGKLRFCCKCRKSTGFVNSCRINNTLGFQSLTDSKCCPGKQKALRFRFVAPSISLKSKKLNLTDVKFR